MKTRRLFRTQYALLVGLLCCLYGCRGRAVYTVISESQAPNGDLTASLVKRHAKMNLANDEYYVVIAKQTTDNGKLEDDAFDSPVLVANHAQNVQVRWSKPDEIEIVCNRCGLETDDILKRKDEWNSVDVKYVGFPSEDPEE
jgi:hypothetical protein